MVRQISLRNCVKWLPITQLTDYAQNHVLFCVEE